MHIDKVSIHNFRVIEQAELTLVPGINLLWGDNGAGKTSVLEAVFVAARGRSFRHQEAGPFIRSGASDAVVVIRSTDDHGRQHVLGIERGAREQRVRLDGADVQRRSEQVRALPLQLLTPSSHALIEGPPELRRRYLDLGMFHVEPQYQSWYTDYQRALRQRNAALRGSGPGAATWDKVISEAAEPLGLAREQYVASLRVSAGEVLARIAPRLRVDIGIRHGWDRTRPLAEQLPERLEIDRRMGYTGLGPHRADILIRAEDVVAAKRLSRGQQKLVVLALALAQAKVTEAASGVRPVMLLDDLPAELDRPHRDGVMAYLLESGLQCLISAVEKEGLALPAATAVFHVEHNGVITPPHRG